MASLVRYVQPGRLPVVASYRLARSISHVTRGHRQAPAAPPILRFSARCFADAGTEGASSSSKLQSSTETDKPEKKEEDKPMGWGIFFAYMGCGVATLSFLYYFYKARYSFHQTEILIVDAFRRLPLYWPPAPRAGEINSRTDAEGLPEEIKLAFCEWFVVTDLEEAKGVTRDDVLELMHDLGYSDKAVFQWWWGDPHPGGSGHWKNYHPHVSAKLEEELARNEKFRDCQEAVPIDEVRYCLQRISPSAPFDYCSDQHRGVVFREQFLPSSRLTVEHPHFDDETRLSQNCFVQFQKGNPRRRRPVRRVRRGEVAGLDLKTESACSICFSDDGFLIGCGQGHLLCKGCRWAALRIVVGDVTQTQNLVCGCLTIDDKRALQGLAEAADKSFQACLAAPPADAGEDQEFQMELAQVRRQFQVRDVPSDIFQRKVADWYEMARRRESEHLYHACVHPGCSMDNWILRIDFESKYRPQGLFTWLCRAGHRNSVLPSQSEINQANRNILSHPEYYTHSCGYDSLSLRRFRFCPGCVDEGLLTFAVHDEGCKQWPGSGTGHRHCFCWHCTKKWGTDCSHSVNCNDPGLQQVRRCSDGSGSEKLEIGFVDAQAYIAWIRTGENCPDTIFENSRILGLTRQGQLKMEDRDTLKSYMDEGTT